MSTTTAASSPARLFVPVRRHGPAVVLRTFLDPGGVRTGVGFTTRELLHEVLGADCACVELGVGALRLLLEARGTTALTVDPRLSLTPSSPLVREQVAA
ncbi:SAV_915 family protein [Kineococcus sp. NPDC059986]|uniref:SAV_915 family protein n=1 Tax=Kineococcus sp. NPDC059986 TaxID=3155538 RepID=UPI00344DB587